MLCEKKVQTIYDRDKSSIVLSYILYIDGKLIVMHVYHNTLKVSHNIRTNCEIDNFIFTWTYREKVKDEDLTLIYKYVKNAPPFHLWI